MTQQILALRSWTGSDAWSTGVALKLARTREGALRALQQAFCGVRGHDTIRCSEGDHLVLRCMHCGHTTSGWHVGRQALRTMRRDPPARPAPRPLVVEPMPRSWRPDVTE